MPLTTPEDLLGYQVHYPPSLAKQAFATAIACKEAGINFGGTPSGQQNSITTYSVSTTGSIEAGAKYISIANTGSSNGTINSATFPKGALIEFIVPENDTLGSITYDATGTTFQITKLPNI